MCFNIFQSAKKSIPNNLNQSADVAAVRPGGVENIGIITGGNNYKVNDSIIFDNTGTKGNGASARVSRVLGKSVNSISVATSSITNVEIYPSDNKGNYTIVCTNPHNFKNGDFVSISGLSTTSSKISGVYLSGVGTNTLAVSGIGTTSSGIGSIASTGIVTYFKVSGNLEPSRIREMQQ